MKYCVGRLQHSLLLQPPLFFPIAYFPLLHRHASRAEICLCHSAATIGKWLIMGVTQQEIDRMMQNNIQKLFEG